MRPRVGLIAVALVLNACATSTWDRPGTGGRRLPIHDDRCFQPLRAYCRGNECLTYQDAFRQMLECPKGRCLIAEEGTCDQLRYVTTGRGFGGSTLYFGHSDRLVAATSWTDAGNPLSACPFWTHYGTPLTCKQVVVEKLR